MERMCLRSILNRYLPNKTAMPISLIIPTYNGLALLKKHLPDVLAALRKGDELIIVDDASTDGTVDYLTQLFTCSPLHIPVTDVACFSGRNRAIEIQVLVNQKNARFAASCNRGVMQAKSDIIVLLNNDVSPERDFISYLLPHFKDESVFGVGCKEKASSERNREYGKSEAHFERGFYVHRRSDDQNTFGPTSWVAGGSGAFRKSMWERLHGFDLDFRPAYGEDIDLSYRAQLHGWKTLFEPKSVVYHVHESTNDSVFGQKSIEVMSFKNAILFMWKNTRGRELLLHFFWLPYHLVFTSIRSQGRFLQGFFLALKQMIF